MNELKQGFRQYIELDDQISILESKLSELRQSRDTVERNIVGIIEKNNLQKKNIKMGDSHFQYTSSEKKDGFTQHYVKKALYDYYGFFYDGKLPRDKCNEKADQVFQYLLANRTIKNKTGLKRIKDDNRGPKQNQGPGGNGPASGPNRIPPVSVPNPHQQQGKGRNQEDTTSISSIRSISFATPSSVQSNATRTSRPTTAVNTSTSASNVRHISIGGTTTTPTSVSTSTSVRSVVIPPSALIRSPSTTSSTMSSSTSATSSKTNSSSIYNPQNY